ncbi:glycine receptor subunit alpha-2-like [Symsagittifera roscoffensis]|uniref:glycine receptor subunit alpha-2-like n=1 Tax=Symsagittifera roscoffensis TaxID=84072 RepID=UPI00307C9D42
MDKNQLLFGAITKYIATVVLIVTLAKCDTKYTKTSEELDNILNNYDKRLRPDFGGEPVEVNVSLHLERVDLLTETMEMESEFTLRLKWTDERLKVSSDLGQIQITSQSFADNIWTPDLYFPESKSVTKIDSAQFVRLNSEGEVKLSRNLKVVSRCPLSFHSYPFDTQECPLIMESFGYTNDQMQLRWLGEVTVSHSASRGAKFYVSKPSQTFYSLHFVTGSFDDLQVEFYFKRVALDNVLRYYFPGILIIALSWLSFWIDTHHVTGRSLVVLISSLALLLSFLNFQMSLNKINHVTMLHLFYLLCFFFIALVVVEFLVVLWIAQRAAKREDGEDDSRGSSQTRLAGTIDFVCRIAFPLSFLFLLFVHCLHV